MNYKLKRRLDHIISDLGDKKITLEELIVLLSTNKEYNTPYQLNEAVTYLTAHNKMQTPKIEEPISKDENIVIENEGEDFSEDKELEDKIAAEDNSSVKSVISQYFGYLNDVDTTVLTREQEQEFFQRIRQGDELAKEEFIYHNLSLVIKIAKFYSSKMSDPTAFEDYIQEGNIGLLTAVEKFNPDLGYKFSTYAVHWIRQSILIAMKTSGVIRLPSYMGELIGNIRKINDIYVQQQNRDATNEEIAEYMNEHGIMKHHKSGKCPFTEKDIANARHYLSPWIISLSIPVGEDQDSTLGDFIPSPIEAPEVSAEKAALVENINKAIDTVLTEREQFVIRKRYGLRGSGRSMTLEDVGALLNVSRERIRQIESKAIRKMKRIPKACNLLEGLMEDNG